MPPMLIDNYLGKADPSLQGMPDYRGGITDAITGPNFVNLRKPYFDSRGRPTVSLTTNEWTKGDSRGGEPRPLKRAYLIRDLQNRGVNSPVFNSTTLRKEEWIQLDTRVIRAARYRLRFWSDLSAACPYGGFNGMGKTLLEYETMSDPGEAVVDMDGLSEGRTDAPTFQLQGLPLPITHSDFWFSARQLAISQNSGTPLSTTMGEAAGRRVAEMIEKTAIGVTTGITYGGASTYVGGYGRNSSVYGLINFTARLTKTNLTVPTGSNPEATLADVLTMRDSLFLNKFYGPFMLYTSNDWDKYMDNDYARAVVGATSIATSKTLRNRLRDIEGIQDVRRLDFLFAAQLSSASGPGTDVDASFKPGRLVMVQMTPDVVEAVNGLDVTTVQWESVGGLRLNFKCMAIQVPRFKADFYGNCGTIDGTQS